MGRSRDIVIGARYGLTCFSVSLQRLGLEAGPTDWGFIQTENDLQWQKQILWAAGQGKVAVAVISSNANK